jgi:hypothetical protein
MRIERGKHTQRRAEIACPVILQAVGVAHLTGEGKRQADRPLRAEVDAVGVRGLRENLD